MDNLWIWLVVDKTPLKNMSSSIGMMTFPTEWENKECSNPPTRIVWKSSMQEFPARHWISIRCQKYSKITTYETPSLQLLLEPTSDAGQTGQKQKGNASRKPGSISWFWGSSADYIWVQISQNYLEYHWSTMYPLVIEHSCGKSLCSMENPLYMAIFHSYVKLPEGNTQFLLQVKVNQQRPRCSQCPPKDCRVAGSMAHCLGDMVPGFNAD